MWLTFSLITLSKSGSVSAFSDFSFCKANNRLFYKSNSFELVSLLHWRFGLIKLVEYDFVIVNGVVNSVNVLEIVQHYLYGFVPKICVELLL